MSCSLRLRAVKNNTSEGNNMPKMKTHRGASKRFKLKPSGVIKRSCAYKSHKANGQIKSRKRKRNLMKGGYLAPSDAKFIRKMIVR